MAEPGRRSSVDGGQDVLTLLDEFADVATFLDSLVTWAVEQTPGAEACGLTLEQAGRNLTVTYSGELAAAGDEMTKRVPLGRIGRPDDMAGIAVFLSSRAGSYLTGAIIPVDGGIAT